MKANTIKLEEPLLLKIYPLLQPKQSLASFVRSALEKEVLRQKLRSSAEEYLEFLNSDRSEQELLQDWETADLENRPPRK